MSKGDIKKVELVAGRDEELRQSFPIEAAEKLLEMGKRFGERNFWRLPEKSPFVFDEVKNVIRRKESKRDNRGEGEEGEA